MKIIIPSRYASTRLPGKPLADIAGKPMIQHVYDRGVAVGGADNVIVACDDQRIFDAIIQVGGQAVLTSPSHQSGTDRIAEAASLMNLDDDDIIINIQGDEPLIPVDLVQATAALLTEHPSAHMSTMVVAMKNDIEAQNPNAVKAVMDDYGRALYFSRAAIPFDRDQSSSVPYYHHVGIYGYRYGALKQMTSAPVSSLERMEQLEQLRALGLGLTIQVGIYSGDIPHGVDTPEDLQAARAALGHE